MDFHPDPALEAFRDHVRDVLRRELPAEIANVPRGIASPRPATARWQRILTARGWGAPYWPAAHGGPGWSIEQQLVFDEECSLCFLNCSIFLLFSMKHFLFHFF